MAAQTTCVHPKLFGEDIPFEKHILPRVKPTNWRQRGWAPDAMWTWLTHWHAQVDKIRSIDTYVRMFVSMKKKAFIDVMYLFVCVLCVCVTLCIIPHPIQLILFISYLSERSYILWTYWHCVHKHLMCIRSLLLSDTALNASIFPKPTNTINSQPAPPHITTTTRSFVFYCLVGLVSQSASTRQCWGQRKSLQICCVVH